VEVARLNAPFVLLDDCRPGGGARLYSDLVETIAAHAPEEVRPCLDRLRGIAAAGFLSYEAGHALEPKLAPLARAADPGAPPLLWFGRFERVEAVDPEALLPDPAGAWAGRPRPGMARADYEAAVERLRERIYAGDIYQANLSFPAAVPVAGDPRALYAAIRGRARGGHGALVFTGTHWILSFSPELFFEMDGKGGIAARPMKGTLARSGTDDAAERAALAADPKQRAENLMIVDLLRNDLSRVCAPGSVTVPALYAIETYPTVHQMTSTVTGRLRPGAGPVDALAALFPCGSIAGAPKIRAMEIIAEEEKAPRSIYTGAIGRLAPDGEAHFNVAIRTLLLRAGEGQARLGLGSGIVADSRAGEEWRECLAKGRFVATTRRFDLIETMRFDPHDGLAELERHLARMKRSADALDFAFDRHGARNELQAATFRAGPSKVRLLLARSGAMAIEVTPLPATPETAEVALAPLPVEPGDFRLRHKTSDRAFYDEARARSGAFEVLFVDPDGFLTEGSFTHLFVETEGRLRTPPRARGLLPGILRERLIEAKEAEEGELRPEDLARPFFIGNAVRGLVPARLRPGSAAPRSS
jgi:para-aminobenzoate synthetase / 4-amino-4-deoxychorismate lyase